MKSEIAVLELQIKMKSLGAAVALAIFVPYFGLLYSSPISFGCLIPILIFSGFCLNIMPEALGFGLFVFSLGWLISIFCAIGGVNKYNRKLIEDYKTMNKS